MKGLAVLAVILLGIIFLSKNFFSATSDVAKGNPNQPTPQGTPADLLGPQGPNDGSNSPVGSGHYVYGDPNPPTFQSPLPVVGAGTDYLNLSRLDYSGAYENKQFLLA